MKFKKGNKLSLIVFVVPFLHRPLHLKLRSTLKNRGLFRRFHFAFRSVRAVDSRERFFAPPASFVLLEASLELLRNSSFPFQIVI